MVYTEDSSPRSSPKNSLKLTYFLPTLLVSGLFGGVLLALVFPALANLVWIGAGAYLFFRNDSSGAAGENLYNGFSGLGRHSCNTFRIWLIFHVRPT